MKLIRLSEHKSLISDFAAFGEKIRAPAYLIGAPSASQITALVHWGFTYSTEFWLVQDNAGKNLVTIGAHVSKFRKGEGTIGFFEADLNYSNIEAAVVMAIKAAEEWLSENGVNRVQAPVNINTWFQYRFSIKIQNKLRFKFEPTTPPLYETFFRQAGYSDHSYYHSVAFPYFNLFFILFGARSFKQTYKHFLQSGFTHRPMNFEKFEELELPFIYDLVHKEFQDTVLFEPLEFEVFKMIYASALKTYDFSPSCVLIDPHQKPAGFMFAFYENNHLVIKSIAIKKEYQGLKLASGLIYQAFKLSKAKGMKACISALVRAGIKSEKIEKSRTKNVGLAWKHEYILLQKDFSL